MSKIPSLIKKLPPKKPLLAFGKLIGAITCPGCDRRNEELQTSCVFCGHSLTPFQEMQTAAPQSNPLTRLLVALPPSTPWDTVTTYELIRQLATNMAKITFRITATGKHIVWEMEAPKKDVELARSIIYAYYPQSSISLVARLEPRIGYAYFPLYGNAFFQPFKYVGESKKLDPLVGVVGALGHCQDDEEVVYELVVTKAQTNYLRLYKKLWEPSTVDKLLDFGFGFLRAMVARRQPIYYPQHQSVEEKREEKQLLEFDAIAREKLTPPLLDVGLSLKVKAATYQRAKELGELIYKATGSLEGDKKVNSLLFWNKEPSWSLVLNCQELATFWHLPSEQMKTQKVIWGAKRVPLSVDLPQGVKLGINAFQGKSREVRLDYPDRVGHVNLIGKSGFGKSTLLHNIVHQDIANGKGVGVIDPHGLLVKDILACSIPPEREKDVIIFDVADTDYPLGLNFLSPVANVNPSEVASQALAIIRRLFAEQWSATQMEDALHATLIALVVYPNATVIDIPRMFVDADFRHQVLAKVTNPAALQFWREDFEVLSPAQQHQLARPIVTRIRKFYRNEELSRIICQPDSLDFRQIMDSKKIFLASLGGLADVEAGTLGSILISKFQMGVMSRGNLAEKLPSFYLTIDEVQNFTTTTLDKVFSEARKYGLSLTVANQFLSQLAGPVLKAVLGNVGASIIMQTNPDDARVVSPFMGDRFDKEDLVTLDKYTAAVTMQLNGQTLPAFSLLTLPPPAKLDNADDIINRLYGQSRKDYGQPKDEIDAAIASRFNADEPPPPDEADEQWLEEDGDDDDLYDDQPPEQNE